MPGPSEGRLAEALRERQQQDGLHAPGHEQNRPAERLGQAVGGQHGRHQAVRGDVVRKRRAAEPEGGAGVDRGAEARHEEPGVVGGGPEKTRAGEGEERGDGDEGVGRAALAQEEADPPGQRHHGPPVRRPLTSESPQDRGSGQEEPRTPDPDLQCPPVRGRRIGHGRSYDGHEEGGPPADYRRVEQRAPATDPEYGAGPGQHQTEVERQAEKTALLAVEQKGRPQATQHPHNRENRRLRPHGEEDRREGHGRHRREGRGGGEHPVELVGGEDGGVEGGAAAAQEDLAQPALPGEAEPRPKEPRAEAETAADPHRRPEPPLLHGVAEQEGHPEQKEADADVVEPVLAPKIRPRDETAEPRGTRLGRRAPLLCGSLAGRGLVFFGLGGRGPVVEPRADGPELVLHPVEPAPLLGERALERLHTAGQVVGPFGLHGRGSRRRKDVRWGQPRRTARRIHPRHGGN